MSVTGFSLDPGLLLVVIMLLWSLLAWKGSCPYFLYDGVLSRASVLRGVLYSRIISHSFMAIVLFGPLNLYSLSWRFDLKFKCILISKYRSTKEI